MANPRTGYYKCPSCNGSSVYESEEITGAMGLTLNTPGVIDPTIINPIKSKVLRCFDCQEISKWHDSAETKAYKMKRDATASTIIGYLFGIVFAVMGFWVISSGLEGDTGFTIGIFVASAVSFLVGYVSSQS